MTAAQGVLGQLSRTVSLLVPPKASPVVAMLAAIAPATETTQEGLLGCRIDRTTGRLLVDATGSGGGGTIDGDQTPSDSYPNPSNAVGAWSLLGAWNRATSDWGRVDRDNLTSSAAIALASAGFALKTSAAIKAYNYSLGNYRSVSCDANGAVHVLLSSSFALADNANLMGGVYGLVDSLGMHRNQGGNFYVSRGGYSQAITAAGIAAIKNALAAGGYNATAPAPADGGGAALQLDAAANLLVQHGRPQVGSRASSDPYYESNLNRSVIKASGGNLLSLYATNREATQELWLMLFDLAAPPSGGETPVLAFYMGAQDETDGKASLGRDFFGQAGIDFANGIAWAVSTTAVTLTLPVSASVDVTATFV